MNDGWPTDFFDRPFAEAVLDRPDAVATARSVAFLIDVLGLRAGSTVFDQGCGTGRLSLPLARRGVGVIGVDLMPEYVALASERARAESLPATFHAADASSWVPPQCCHGAFNWGTSFGFHRDPARNTAMVRCAVSALAPGGRFVLDVANADRLRASLRPVWRQSVVTHAGEVEILRRSHIDASGERFVQEWTFSGAVHAPPRAAETWLMSREALEAMFVSVGLRCVATFGSDSGDPFTPESERCIVLGERVM